jgi:aminoglycoside/choline kinase family phosphotransferase
MELSDAIYQGYRQLFGNSEIKVTRLPVSGSDRKYFRISDPERTIIGAYNPVNEENAAFIGFTEHFLKKGLRVPEIYGILPEKHIYFLQDLGDINLFEWLKEKQGKGSFDEDTKKLFRKILDQLIMFQTKGVEDLNLDLCYPHRSFDRQSMMWDMNYFKYMLLKLLAVPFNEQRLEHDFNALADYLLQTSQDYFLYRDFQSANIMIISEIPWFIDYQGGRKGAPQYDVASLLYDAKIKMQKEDREELLRYYTGIFCQVTGEDESKFTGYFTGFSMIRLMQALGAFGFRGLYEQKPTFTESLVPGVKLLNEIILSAETFLKLPELYSAIRALPDSAIIKSLSKNKQ